MFSGTHLLVDGKNVLYRAIFASGRDNPIDIFFRIVISSMHKAEADFCHIFWDCPRKEVWRRKVLPSYKASRPKSDPEIGKLIGKCDKSLQEACKFLGIKNYYQAQLEADDLIYAFASVYQPTNIVILSSDKDLYQIPFRFQNTRQLKPGDDFVERPEFNPVLQKALMGDKSDNILGYKGIGPKKSEKFVRNPEQMLEFLRNDPRTFLFNLNIVDLALCPLQMRAQFSVINTASSETNFDFNAARGIFHKNHLHPDLVSLDWSVLNEKKEI